MVQLIGFFHRELDLTHDKFYYFEMAKIKLSEIDPNDTGKFKNKKDVEADTEKYLEKLYQQLYLMFAHGRYSLLVILHGIDASGKDGTINHIFSGANPQAMKTFSFKRPSDEELRHDFLWRCHKHVPEVGYATIFNRSYYEEVTTVMVHPELLKEQHLPDNVLKDKNIFKKRYEQINDFEKMLCARGTQVIKFLLHISKDEQKQRLDERLDDRTKNWKFSEDDLKERKLWDDYMDAFEKMVNATNTQHSPWHVIPANHKWYRNHQVSKLIVERLADLKMSFPKSSE